MDGQFVTVLRSGIYDIQFGVQIPADVALGTMLVLQRNNESLLDMALSIDHPTGASAVYTIRGILEVTAPATFRLSSSRAISYSGPGTLASWQFLQIG